MYNQIEIRRCCLSPRLYLNRQISQIIKTTGDRTNTQKPGLFLNVNSNRQKVKHKNSSQTSSQTSSHLRQVKHKTSVFSFSKRNLCHCVLFQGKRLPIRFRTVFFFQDLFIPLFFFTSFSFFPTSANQP